MEMKLVTLGASALLLLSLPAAAAEPDPADADGNGHVSDEERAAHDQLLARQAMIERMNGRSRDRQDENERNGVATDGSMGAPMPGSVPEPRWKPGTPEEIMQGWRNFDLVRPRLWREACIDVEQIERDIERCESARVYARLPKPFTMRGRQGGRVFTFGGEQHRERVLLWLRHELLDAQERVSRAASGYGIHMPEGSSHEWFRRVPVLGEVGVLYGGEVMQVLDDESMLYELDPPGDAEAYIVKISGVSTIGLTDGLRAGGLAVGGWLRATTTARYETAMGATRTVMQLEPVSVDEWIDFGQTGG